MATTAERLAQYEDLFNKSQQYDQNAFQQNFKKAYGEATNYNEDLIRQQANALGELQSVAPTMRSELNTGLMVDPIAQRSLIAKARQTPISDYGTASNLLAARGNKYSDILNTALGGYQTAAQQAQTAAENAWRLYQDQLAQDEAARDRANQPKPFDVRDLIDSDRDGIPDYMDDTPYGDIPGGPKKRVYEIPENTPRPANITNVTQDLLAKGINDYRDAPNIWQKYLQLQKGTLGSLASMPLTGLAGPAAYATGVLPSVWSDIKSLFNRK